MSARLASALPARMVPQVRLAQQAMLAQLVIKVPQEIKERREMRGRLVSKVLLE